MVPTNKRRAANLYAGRAFGHAERLRIWLLIVERSRDRGTKISPRQVAEELGLELPRCAYHVRELAAARVIKAAGTGPVRGAVEHFYRAVKTPQEVFDAMLKAEQAKLPKQVAA